MPINFDTTICYRDDDMAVREVASLGLTLNDWRDIETALRFHASHLSWKDAKELRSLAADINSEFVAQMHLAAAEVEPADHPALPAVAAIMRGEAS